MTRQEGINKLIEDYNLSGILLINLEYPFIDPNFIYITQPKSGIFEYSILFYDGEINLYTNKLEFDAAKEIRGKIYLMQNFYEQLKQFKKYSRIGINAKFLPTKLFNFLKNLGIQLVDISEDLEEIREIKTKEEIENVKKAIKISEKALNKVLSLDLRELKEKELKAELEYYMNKYGASGFAFDTIVAYDENSALPHYRTGTNDKYPEKVILIDFGAKYNNYCSDITRTFILTNDKEIIEAYNTVLEAQTKAIEAIEIGKEAGEIDRIARNIIESKYGNVFIHSLGHMFGIEIHEGKRLYKDQHWKIKEGHLFTIEPGAYFKGKFGIRIEDDIYISKKVEILTNFPKDIDFIRI